MESEARYDARESFGHVLHRVPILFADPINDKVHNACVLCGFYDLLCLAENSGILQVTVRIEQSHHQFGNLKTLCEVGSRIRIRKKSHVVATVT